MAKSIKLKNNTYIDSTSIAHDKNLLSEILEDIILNNDLVNEILERNGIEDVGSNTNGSYIKYKNGLMVCYGTVSMGNQTFTIDWWNTLNRSGNEDMRITYPQTFKSIPTCTLTSVCQAGILFVGYQGTTEQTPAFTIVTPKGANYSREVIMNYVAIGQWK